MYTWLSQSLIQNIFKLNMPESNQIGFSWAYSIQMVIIIIWWFLITCYANYIVLNYYHFYPHLNGVKHMAHKFKSSNGFISTHFHLVMAQNGKHLNFYDQTYFHLKWVVCLSNKHFSLNLNCAYFNPKLEPIMSIQIMLKLFHLLDNH